MVMVCVDEDLDRARDLARPWLTVYLGGMGAKGKNFYVDAAERSGQGEAAREVQRLFMEGDRAGAAAALTPELIDSSAVCCRPASSTSTSPSTSARAPPPCSRCRSATARRSSTQLASAIQTA